MDKNSITDVFFDLDHTLWDFEKNSALTFEKIFKINNITIPIPDFLAVYVPQNLIFWRMYREEKITKENLRYQRLKTVFDLLEEEVSDATIHKLADGYIEHLSTFNHLFPDTLEVLDYLKSKYTLHIITNGFHEVQERKMRNSNIWSYFDCVVDSEMAGVKKPNPAIFHLALNKANAKPETSVMIGDSMEADILGALAVGMHAIHFNAHGDALHEICPAITELKEIKDLL